MLTLNSKSPINIPRDKIRLYYYIEFNQFKTKNSGVIVDDSCYELMFVKEKNVKIIDGNGKIHLLPQFYTLNNLKGPFRFEFPNTFSSFCVKLQPWMNTSYVPAKNSQVLDLSELYNKNTNDLHQAIFNTNSIDEMVDLVEEFLNGLSILPNKDVELIKNICSLIYERSGDITVKEIADTFNIYRQKLNALFKKEVKYTLKVFINNVRIRSCLAYKLSNPQISLTEIAYKFGFYDQAHFIHSFKNACGVSPSDYVKDPGYSFLSWERLLD